ncbi:uncharacterized protein LOC108592867 [Callithrix jacchus]
MARASSRPSQARGRRRGRGRGCCSSRTGIRDPRRRPAYHAPPAEGRGGSSYQASQTVPAAGRFPLQPAARPARPRLNPGGQVPRSPSPREPPGRGRSVPPDPSSDVSVSRRRGKGAGERRSRPFLRLPPPAGIAAGGARARRSAAQRPGGAGALATPLPTVAWAPPLPPFPASPLPQTPAGATPPRRTTGRCSTWR